MRILKLLTVLLVLTTNIIFAQTSYKFTQQEKDKNGNLSFVNLSTETKNLATEEGMQSLLKQICSPCEHVSFKQQRSYTDIQNYTHYVYQAFYDDLELKGMGYVIHAKDNTIQYANGSLLSISKLQTKPTINEQFAISKALAFYKITFPEADIKTTQNKQILFCINQLREETTYLLAYKIVIETKRLSDNYFIYVDANNGDILCKEPMICQGHHKAKSPPNAPGTAQTRYSGTQNIISDAYNGAFRLRENRGNVNIITRNALNSYDELNIANNATDFFDNTNTWTAAAQGIDQPATDAHWGAEKVLDYWQQIRGRNSIDGLGMPLRSYVHYGLGEDNAGWTGPPTQSPHIPNSMVYGDGSFYFKPLTALDVVAHEFGHGVCQFTSGLVYGSAESGALNEGFSDIWGATIEAWAAPNKQRWLIGEEITLVAPFYLRSMSNPPSGAFAPSSDTYGDANWNAISDPHYRSGVLNKWYYLLTEGGSGTNGIGNAYSLLGIGMNKAANIAYMTEQNLFNNSNYAQARTISIQVTRNFYGIGSCEEIAVTRAWYAVGVGANYTGPLPPPVPSGASIVGNNTVCGSATYTINLLPAGSIVTWSSSNTAIATVVPTTNGNAIVTKTGVGTCIISASLSPTAPGSCSPEVLTKTISTDAALDNVILTAGLTSCTGTGVSKSYTLTNVPSGSNIVWSFENGLGTIASGQGTSTVQITGPTQGIDVLKATINAACGQKIVAQTVIFPLKTTLTTTQVYISSIYTKIVGGQSYITFSYASKPLGSMPSYYIWVINGIEQTSHTNSCVVNVPNYDCNDPSSPAFINYNIKVYACGNYFECNQSANVCAEILVPQAPCVIILPQIFTALSNNNTNLVEESSITISPNPSNGNFKIMLNGNNAKAEKIHQVIIKDQMGNLVYQQKYASKSSTQDVSLSNTKTGVYFVSVFNGLKWNTQKISLQK